MWCKENLKRTKRNKHEINTNLPLARTHRLKSDVHDSSSIMIEHPSWVELRRIAMLSPPLHHWSARPKELDEAELLTFRHTFFAFFFLLGVEGWCSS
jgi:hypothetical protein